MMTKDEKGIANCVEVYDICRKPFVWAMDKYI